MARRENRGNAKQKRRGRDKSKREEEENRRRKNETIETGTVKPPDGEGNRGRRGEEYTWVQRAHRSARKCPRPKGKKSPGQFE